jgi:hypothetical protein
MRRCGDAASVISSRRPADVIVDVYSVFEEGSGGLLLLRPEETGPLTGLEERTDSGERVNKEFKPVESTEGVFTGEESARIESVGSTDEVVTIEDKITEPDHGFAQATLLEKGGGSGGGKEGTETERKGKQNKKDRGSAICQGEGCEERKRKRHRGQRLRTVRSPA